MDEDTRGPTTKRFDLSYVMAKESIPFGKYPALVQLEQRHRVDMCQAYNTQESLKNFTGFIAKSQRQAFLSSLFRSSHFFSLLMDGTTDAGNIA